MSGDYGHILDEDRKKNAQLVELKNRSFGEKINGRKNISDSLRNNPLLDKRLTPG